MAALIPLGSAHEQEQWGDELLQEYLNANVFKPFMRAGELRGNAIVGEGNPQNGLIVVLDALGAKRGTKINIPLRRALTNAGVTGDQRLEGNEEEMVFDNDSITIDLLRHATIIRNVEMSEQRTAFEIFSEARPALTDWSEEKLRDDIITAMFDTDAGRVQSRYLYGAAESNWNATHTTALANVDDTNDKLTVAHIKKLKDKAKAGDTANGVGRIRPAAVTMENGAHKKTYVLFTPTKARRQLEEDTDYQNMQFRNQTAGESQAPRFVDTSNFIGMIDGVLAYEIEDMDVLAGVGASSIDVAHSVLCGAQSVAVVYGKRPFFTQQGADYGNEQGVAVNEMRGIDKLVYNGADYGIVHSFTSGEDV